MTVGHVASRGREDTELTKTPDHQRLSPETLAKYVEVLGRTGRHDMASAAVGVTTTTSCKWRNAARRNPEDPKFQVVDPLGLEEPVDFHTAVEEAWRGWLDTHAEAKLIQMAMGYKDPVVYQGRLTYEPDTDADPLVDPISGLIYFPPKKDPLTGQPIPLTIERVDTGSLKFFHEKRNPNYKIKSEVDITSGGKPIFFPAKATDRDAFLKANGANVVKVKKPDPNA